MNNITFAQAVVLYSKALNIKLTEGHQILQRNKDIIGVVGQWKWENLVNPCRLGELIARDFQKIIASRDSAQSNAKSSEKTEMDDFLSGKPMPVFEVQCGGTAWYDPMRLRYVLLAPPPFFSVGDLVPECWRIGPQIGLVHSDGRFEPIAK